LAQNRREEPKGDRAMTTAFQQESKGGGETSVRWGVDEGIFLSTIQKRGPANFRKRGRLPKTRQERFPKNLKQ